MPSPLKLTAASGSSLTLVALFLSIAIFALTGVAQDTRQTNPDPTTSPTTTQKAAHLRKPTLDELYAMFFKYAAHVEARSIADEALGKDRSVYRQHLQKASGLTTEEYALVLASAIRYAQADVDAATMLRSLYMNNPQGDPPVVSPHVSEQAGAILAARRAALADEITNVRASLGNERAGVFESYLLHGYDTQPAPHPLSIPIAASHSSAAASPAAPSSSKSFSFPPGTQYELQKPVAAALTQDSAAAPDEVTATGAQQCVSGYTFEYSGAYEICADSELSWVEGDEVEPYASLYAEWWGTFAWDYLLIQGDFYVDGSFYNNLGCFQYYYYEGSYIGGTSCYHSPDVQLDSPSGTVYDWTGVTSIGIYDSSCVVPDGCAETTNSVTSDGAEVQIFYPDINSITPQTVNPGDSGTLVIDGEYLISPFLNPPSVSISNPTNFSSFTMEDYDYEAGTITVYYSVSQSAAPGTYTISANNGFGADTADLTINAPPSITGPGGSQIASSPSSPVQVLAGQQNSLSVAAPPGEAIQSQSWSFGNPGDAVGGYNAYGELGSGQVVQVTGTNQASLTFYFIVPGQGETVTVNVVYTNGQSASATVYYTVDGPTGISVSNVYPVAPVQVWADPMQGGAWFVELGTGNDGPASNYGIAVQATASHLPSSAGANAGFQWVQLVTGSTLNLRQAGVSQSMTCQEPVALPALDATYPALNGEVFEDSPGSGLASNYGELQDSDSLQAYLMWDPALPSGCIRSADFLGSCTSIPIPLGTLKWSWSGDAINTLTPQPPNNGTTFSQNCGSEAGDAGSFVQGSEFPIWTSIVPYGEPVSKLVCSPSQ